MVRNPIGTKSEALQRQRTRQSLRKHIMESQAHGLLMNTENLLQYNPKLADVSHTTRIAYAKFMTTKIKKEIKFDDEQVKVEDELARARGAKAFNKFKANAGILKKREAPKEPEIVQNGNLSVVEVVPPSISPPASPVNSNVCFLDASNFPATIERDFRSRTPIQEEIETPSDLPSTPNNFLDQPQTSSRSQTPSLLSSSTPKISSPSPSPSPSKSFRSQTKDPETSSKREDTPILTPRSRSPSCAIIPEIKTPEPLDPKVPKERKRSLSPQPPVSPAISISGSDKGKSKISGKTLTGWL